MNLVISSRCNDMQLTGVAFAGLESGSLNSIVATVYDYKSILVWDDAI